MLKKISTVLCVGLFAVALSACKKDEKGAGGASNCDALGPKMKEAAAAEMGDMKDMPPEAKKQMDDMVGKMSAMVVTACKEDKWSKEAIDCAIKAKDPEKECDDKLTDEQKKKMEERAEKMMGEMMPAMPTGEDKPDEAAAGAAGATAGAAGAAATGGSGLPECDAYTAAVEKYLTCDKVPQEARDAAKTGLDTMKQGWANAGQMPDDAKKMAADACKQAVDALKQGASSMGCEI